MDDTPKQIDVMDLFAPLWADVLRLKVEVRLLRQALKDHDIDLDKKISQEAMTAEMRKELEKDLEDSPDQPLSNVIKLLLYGLEE